MYAHPGKKLLFMGSEIGQYEEWNHAASVPWDLIQFDYHRKLQVFVSALNRFYADNRALYEVDFHYSGFEWVDFRDVEHSVIAFLRKAADPNDFVLFCCNFTPVVRGGYEFGVPAAGVYDEVFNTDADCFGGGNVRNGAGIQSRAVERHGRPHSISITLPPLAVVAFRRRA
jgi:1,4-alpha-glucan branching enzyme